MVDLLECLSKKLGFNFRISSVKDGRYVHDILPVGSVEALAGMEVTPSLKAPGVV